MLQGFRCVGDHHGRGGQKEFLGEKWDSGWSHMMGEIWIRGEKGAQAGTEPEKSTKSRKAQSMLLRQEGPGQLRNMTSQRNRDIGSLGQAKESSFFFFPSISFKILI